MRPLRNCLVTLSVLAGEQVGAENVLSFVRQGVSDYTIVIPSSASPVETTAARELQHYLRAATGASLPILGEDEEPASRSPRILVGHGKLTRQLLPEMDPASFRLDTIVLKSVGSDLILGGHPRRGALYAVFTFLEEVVGVRWWSMDETYIPVCPTLVVPFLDTVYAPPLIDRATRYLELSDGCFTSHALVTPEEQQAMGIFSAHLRLNGHDHYCIPAAYGGPNSLIGWVHTFYQINGLLPPETYFAEHPDWYSLVDGKRVKEKGQLCLSNSEMRQEMVRVVLERLRRTPNATMISVSQNDWHGNCQCDACRAVDDHEGSPSGSLIHFINAVAEEVEKEFPEVLIETLAYQYTRKPPKYVRPRANVVVRLCSIECSFSEPLESGERNRPFREDLEGWSRICDKLYIWDYVTNFHDYCAPHPNLHVLANNLRFFVRNHAVGVFEQGDSGCRVGDFVRLRAWLLAHLLWNPDLDEAALADQFMTGYYGAAAPWLTAYREVLREAVERADIHLGCFHTDTSDWLRLSDLNRSMELFDRALEAVHDDEILTARVRRERLVLDHVWLQRYPRLKRAALHGSPPFAGPTDPGAALNEFSELLRRHRAGEIRQGRAFPDRLEELFEFDSPKAPPPVECRGLAEENWIDIEETDYIPRRQAGLFSIVDDPAAANGRTRRMPNTHTVWACHSYPLAEFGIRENVLWQVRFVVRCDAAVDQGDAMTIGVYDETRRQNVTSRKIPVREIRGDRYTSIDLGTHRLSGSMYLWAAPVIRKPDEVEAVYVDRIFLVPAPTDVEKNR